MTIDSRSEQNFKILRHLRNFSDTQVFGKFTKYFNYTTIRFQDTQSFGKFPKFPKFLLESDGGAFKIF